MSKEELEESGWVFQYDMKKKIIYWVLMVVLLLLLLLPDNLGSIGILLGYFVGLMMGITNPPPSQMIKEGENPNKPKQR
jgi:hypothetical protein